METKEENVRVKCEGDRYILLVNGMQSHSWVHIVGQHTAIGIFLKMYEKFFNSFFKMYKNQIQSYLS